MWQSIETAPTGKWIQVKQGDKMVKHFVREYCHVLLNGKSYWTCMLESKRWNGFSVNDKPNMWHPAPALPESEV